MGGISTDAKTVAEVLSVSMEFGKTSAMPAVAPAYVYTINGRRSVRNVTASSVQSMDALSTATGSHALAVSSGTCAALTQANARP